MRVLAVLLLCLLPVPSFARQDEKILRACWGPGPEQLDPARIDALQDARYAYALFEGLVTYGADNVTPVPGLAEKWEVSKDGLTYTFHLRGAKWSDGTTITASVVAASWRRALDPKTDGPFAGLFERIRNIRAWRLSMQVTDAIELFPARRGGIRYELAEKFQEGARAPHEESLRRLARAEGDKELKKRLNAAADAAAKRPALRALDLGIKAINDSTLRITLERPTPYFLSLVGFVPFLPVPMHAVQKHGNDWTRTDLLIGNGPYVLSERSAKEITLTRNASYRDKPGPDKIVLSLFQEPKAALHLYRNDKLDWLETEAVPPEKLGELTSHPDFRAYETLGTFFVRFNTEKDQFSICGQQ